MQFSKSSVRDSQIDSQVLRRLRRDLVACQDGTLFGIAASPCDGDMLRWLAVILGPKGTPWEGGKFVLEMAFPGNYPFRPPTVRFTIPVEHPNIDPTSGIVYMDVLGDADGCCTWSPAWCASSVLMGIQSLLNDPNPDLVVNGASIEFYERNRPLWNQAVRNLALFFGGMPVPEHLERMLRY